MSKNVAVFVDVANIFYAAKAAGVDIDYVTLLRSASAGRDLVRAYAYTGLDPDNENQRNFHSFLARSGYRVVSKDIRKYGDGKVKANLDIELVVDMMKTARNLDIAIVVSGDGDFAPAIRAVQETGVRVEVISFRGNTSSDLMEVADQFTDITALAKVEKGSSRSGRRVAESDEDLSMTEVPDKQTDGVGGARGGRGGRGRGGRGRGREDLAPVARIRRAVSEPAAVAAVTSSGAPLTVLPGEKLSRVAGPGGDAGAQAPTGGLGPVDLADGDLDDPETGGAVAVFGGGLSGVATTPLPGAPGDDEGDLDAQADGQAEGEVEGEGEGEGEGEDAEGRRRRRRRGGRGRGRGRGREGEALETPVPQTAGIEDIEIYEEPVEAPRGPRTTPFGSVWDSQIGVPALPTPSGLAPLSDDEDFDEPEIPEYLIAERNRGRQVPGQGQRSGRGGPRGGRSAYAAAMDRERYGRGGGGGGINRYPDVSARERPPEPRREERFARPAGAAPGGPGGPSGPSGGGRRSSSDEWSEVPPELEAMLRAQLGNRPADRRPARPAAPPPADLRAPEEPVHASLPPESDAAVAAIAAEAVATSVRRGRRPARPTPETAIEQPAGVEATSPAEAGADVAPAPKRRAPRRSTAAAGDAPAADTAAAGDAEAAATPKRRTTRRPAVTAEAPAPTEGGADVPTGGDVPAAADAPKRRVTRRKPAATAAQGDAEAGATADAPTTAPAKTAPKRRTTRRKVGEESPGG